MQQLLLAARASQNLGLDAHATFSGALLWHTMYPWPQRPPGLVETGFRELADALVAHSRRLRRCRRRPVL